MPRHHSLKVSTGEPEIVSYIVFHAICAKEKELFSFCQEKSVTQSVTFRRIRLFCVTQSVTFNKNRLFLRDTKRDFLHFGHIYGFGRRETETEKPGVLFS